MKKLSLLIVFVMLLVAVLAFSTSAASFTRGEENTTITKENVELAEKYGGETTKGSAANVLDGSYSTYWGAKTGGKIRITLVNEWEIKEAKIAMGGNWSYAKVTFYADDGNGGMIELGTSGSVCDKGTDGIYGGGISPDNTHDISGAVNKLSYGDSDKAVKYIVIENTGAKWEYLPAIYEIVLVGRERIPSVGCESHVWDTMYEPAPTCTESGLAIRYCTVCGAAEPPITAPALGHKIGEYDIITDATCTHGATIRFDCANGCGETIERDMYIQDVTDFGDWFSIKSNGAGGNTSSGQSLFDNNMDSYLHASGGWFVESSIDLDMPYYISSVTVWTGSYSNFASWEAKFTFYYKASAADSEWIQVGVKQAAVEYGGNKYAHTLELDTPVQAGAIKIKVDKLCSFDGQAFEAEVAGSLLAETVAANHDWVAGEAVAPDCGWLGYTPYTCSTCGETKKDNFVKNTGKHNYVEFVEHKDSLCYDDGDKNTDDRGYDKYKCDNCLDITTIYIPVGHDGAPTCTEAQICPKCGETVAEATGHTWGEDNACDNCDAVRVATIGEVSYLTFEEALAAAVEGDTIVVLDKVTVEGDVTWDLTGKTIQFPNVVDNYAVVVKGNLTIVGGTFTFAGEYGIGVQKTASLTINDGTFTTVGTFYLIGSWGTTVINGGSYEAYYNVVNCFAGTLSVTGGTFVAKDDGSGYGPDAVLGEDEGVATITGGTFNTDVTAYLAPEYIQVDGAVIACPHAEYSELTCTDDSVCLACGKLGEEALGHVESTVEGSAPTCTEDGLTDGVVCEECGAVLEAQKTIPAAHTWSEEVNVITEPTCIKEGVGKYYCTVCWDTNWEMVYDEVRGEIAIPVNPSAHADMPFVNDQFNFAVCPDCDAFKFYQKHSGIGNSLNFWFLGDSINIYGGDFDEYYCGANYSVVDGVYTFELVESEHADTTYVGAQVTITFNDDDTLYITLTNGEDTYYFGKDPNAKEDLSSELNGTYQYVQDGAVIFEFVLNNGTVVWTINGGAENGYETTYTYDGETFECALALTLEDGVLYYSFRGTPYELSLYVPQPPQPPVEPEVDYGELIGSMEVETTDTYGPFDLYSYTANEAGKYTFFFPAGLGAVDKAAAESFGVPSIFELDYCSNATGEFVSINLEAGETLEFFIIATTKDTWTINVYYYVEEDVCNHEKTEIIPVVRPTPSTVGYTAGVMCLDCEEVIVAPKAINVTELENAKDPDLRVASASLDLAESICVFYKAQVNAGMYSNVYMVFIYEGEEYVITDYTIEAGTGRYVFRFDKVLAYKMAKNIEAYVYGETAEGEYSMNKILEYSVMQYCINQLKKNIDAEFRTVLSDVLALGAANQIYEGFETDALITDLVAAQGYTLTPSVYAGIPADKNVQAVLGDRTTGIDWKSANLLVGSNIKVQLKFAADDIEGLTVKVNVAGEDKYFTSEDFTMDGDRYVVVVDYLTSMQYDETITATFYKGEEQVGSTLTYSVNSYLVRNAENTSHSATMRSLLQTIYTYGETMKAYFAN